ncbi:recovery protein 3 [Actinidia rufa]|uniref:Recovery protein 3 n=1 Tax=Actinidia rufa TaxID=165716 RepID=A0A7J0EZS6_9ERIC|nr:recovery protein 3 [Actinidia rufa]
MGHLHVSKIKFRHPVPNSSAWRKDNNNRHGPGKDNPTCTSAGLQADPSEDAALCSQIWMSSTIPDGWMWECPSQLDTSSCQDVHLVKRQSTCELEGDATVDEILNQQFKMYSSLSQTRSDVKMVQSLIPMWEEEYERTGRHGVALLFDPGKPLPGDVLRTLSLGLELENKLMELCNEAENDSYCTPLEKVARYAEPMRPTDEQNMIESGLCDPRKDDGEALKFLKVGNETTILPQGSSWDDDDVIIAGEGKAVCPKQLLVDDLQLSRTNGSSDVKVICHDSVFPNCFRLLPLYL